MAGGQLSVRAEELRKTTELAIMVVMNRDAEITLQYDAAGKLTGFVAGAAGHS
jgi:hypothetical protein